MGKFLKSMSLFASAEGSDAALAGNGHAPDDPPATAPATTPAETTRTTGRRHEVVPRMDLAAVDHVAPVRKARPSRALNLPRQAAHVTITPHPMPAQARTTHAHSPHARSVVLTETERLRLQLMQVQIRLSSLDLYDGPIDGIMSPDTVTGVRYFQTLKGMRDSGQLTAGTLSALGIAPIS